MERINNFIVIDDDPIINIISRQSILGAFPDANVHTFTDPMDGLNFIISSGRSPSADQKELVIFLDINMPMLSGWDILDKLKNLSGEIKQKFKIYMLSKSEELGDKQKAADNPFVTSFIEKPLLASDLHKLFS